MNVKIQEVKPTECDSCGYETIKLEYFRHCKKYLCKICSSSGISSFSNYSDQITKKHILESIAFVGNMILNEIRSLKE